MAAGTMWAGPSGQSDTLSGSNAPKPILLTNPEEPQSLALDLSPLMRLGGFIGGCVIDRDTGMMLSSIGGDAELDLELAGALSADIVRAQQASIDMLEQEDKIEDVMVSTRRHYHLMRPLKADPSVFIYTVLDRARANLAVTRIKLRAAELRVHV